MGDRCLLLDPIPTARGLGAEESGTERTGSTHCPFVGVQHGVRLAEFGQHYDLPNLSVMRLRRRVAQLAGVTMHGFRLAGYELRVDHVISMTRMTPMSLIGDTDLNDTRAATSAPAQSVTFNRLELNRILNLYGRMVAAGEWRDYAIDFLKDRAVFSIYRRASEVPLYRIEKDPKLARRQGVYSVIAASGQILRRGHELDRVLLVIDRKLELV